MFFSIKKEKEEKSEIVFRFKKRAVARSNEEQRALNEAVRTGAKDAVIAVWGADAFPGWREKSGPRLKGFFQKALIAIGATS
jgi:hypothetical protein